MHTTFGYYLTVEVSYFLKIPRITCGHRARSAGSLSILVVGDRAPVFRGKSFLIHTIIMGAKR